MQSQTITNSRTMPNRWTRLVLGLLVLSLTLLIVFTAAAPILGSLFVDDVCETVPAEVSTSFSLATAVSDCWLVP